MVIDVDLHVSLRHCECPRVTFALRYGDLGHQIGLAVATWCLHLTGLYCRIGLDLMNVPSLLRLDGQCHYRSRIEETLIAYNTR